MEYHSHLAKFIEKSAAVDYFLTGLILHRFFPDPKGNDKNQVQDFMNYFVTDKENGISFGRKITLFSKICEKKYPDIIPKYPSLSKSNLKLINVHRNNLAHSLLHPLKNKEVLGQKKFILTSNNPDFEGGDYILHFNKCQDMEILIQKTVLEMRDFYRELGIIE
jgi:hypothetical protein